MKNSILLNIIKGLIIVTFFTPLIVNGNFIFPFVFPKTAAFQILVEIMFFVWVWLFLSRPEFRPTKTRIFWAISLFLTMVFLASAFGVNFGHSFWSNYERMTGIITLLHYFVFFVILSSVLKTKKEWFLIFDFFIAASLLVSFIGLGQKINIQGLVMAGAGRLSATLGNPAYLAAYLLFVLFLTAFLFFQRPSRKAKIYYAIVFAFNVLILYWTETRGALLAFGVAVILFLLALIFWPKNSDDSERSVWLRKKIKKIALGILITFIIFVALVYFSRDAAWVKKSATLSRLTSISLTETTTQTRVLAWGMSWQGFLEKPILGWGWENYNVVFNKFYNPLLFPAENWFDRAHNIVFDTLVTTGAVGFLSFLGIFGATFFVLWRAWRQKRVDFLNAALFGILLVAYLAQDLFVFDMLFSYLPLFLILAFVNWIGIDKTPDGQPEKKAMPPNLFLKVILAIIFIVIVYLVNIKPALTSYYGINGLRYGQQPQQAVDFFKKALSYNTFGRFETRLQIFEAGKNVARNYQNYSDKKAVQDLLNLALTEGDKTVKELPLDARYLLSIGELNLVSSSIYPERISQAIEFLEKAYQLSSQKQIILFALGEAKVRQGKTDEGIGYFKKAIELNDNVYISHWNLALIYFAVGDQANGEKKVDEIEQKFGQVIRADDYKKIANLLGVNKNYQAGIKYILKAIERDPKNGDLYAYLAGFYAEAGDKEKAKQAVQKAVELNPTLKQQAEEFIKSLGE